MTGRDRIVAMVLAVIAVLAAAWILLVSPERKQASSLGGQLSSAQAQLSSAESQLATARADEAAYPSAYAAVVSLGKAVPAGQEVPSLIYELETASNQKRVEFASITSGTGASSSSSAAPAAAAAGFTQMPFTFVFNGSFFDLEHLFEQLSGFARRTSAGSVQVSGRLLTIQSVKLSPASTSSAGPSAGNELAGTITATAYVLPAGQGLSGATAAAPAGAPAPGPSGTTPSSPTTPAVVTP